MGCQENADNDLPQQSDIIVFYVFFETNVVTFIKCLLILELLLFLKNWSFWQEKCSVVSVFFGPFKVARFP